MNIFLEQLSRQVSNPYSLFFFLAFALSLFMFHMKARRKILATKFLSDANYATYYFLIGGLPGAMGAMIAGLGGLVQAITPDKHFQRTRYWRLGVAVILSLIAIYFSAAKSTDLLPLFAIIIGRLAEMSSTPQKVRLRMALTFPPWMVYNILHGYYLLVFANATVLFSLFWAIWKHHSIKHRVEPV